MSKGETRYSSLERVQVSPPFVHAYNELPAFVGGSPWIIIGSFIVYCPFKKEPEFYG